MADIISKILKVFQENGLFEEGVELIGSWCFSLYQRHLGVKSFPLRTPDIDFIIPRPFKGKKKPNFINQLESLGFKIDFNSDGSIYLWNAELKIEFLTCEKGRGTDHAIEIKELGFKATPLRYMSILLDKPIMINDRGIKVKAPNPVSFCLHKLLVASKRKKPDKKLKDIEQAVLVSAIIEADQLRTAFISLPKKWQKTILDIIKFASTKMPMLNSEINHLRITLHKEK